MVNSRATICKIPAAPRWYYAECAALFLALAAIILCLMLPSHSHASQKPNVVLQMGLVFWFGLVLILSELLRRLCLLFEEWHHLELRYDNNKWFLTSLALHFEVPAFSLMLFDILGLIICSAAEPLLAGEINAHAGLSCGISAVYLVFFLLVRMQESPVDWNRELEKRPLSVGQGLAYAYFQGYLKIILPADKTDNGLVGSFKERAEGFGDRMSLKATSVYTKLLILVPQSCFCCPDFESMDPGNIEKVGKMEEILFSRAGMSRRPYPVVVYRINDPYQQKDPIYVPLDMPSILLTIYEMNTVGSSRAALSQAEMLMQVNSFLYVLKGLLDKDPSCREQYEILYYKDKDDEGNSVPLGKLIWDHAHRTSMDKEHLQ